MRSISSANLKLLIFLPPIAILDDLSSREYCIILSRNMLNTTGGSKQPYLTPTVVLKAVPIWLFNSTALFAEL